MDRAVKIDAQGRVAIPAAMRASLGLQTGDTLFAHAGAEYRAGLTTSLRDFAASEGIDLEGADEASMQG